jgi:hypothetical protein
MVDVPGICPSQAPALEKHRIERLLQLSDASDSMQPLTALVGEGWATGGKEPVALANASASIEVTLGQGAKPHHRITRLPAA